MRIRLLGAQVLIALVFTVVMVGVWSPGGTHVYGQSDGVVRVTIVLHDAPVAVVYRDTLQATGNRLLALRAALDQYRLIQSAQNALIARLTDPMIDATIIRREVFSGNLVYVEIDQDRIIFISAYPEVQSLLIQVMGEYQATMGELTAPTPVPASGPDFIEMPVPGEPPGR